VNTPEDLLRFEPGPTVVCVIGKKKSGKTTTVVGLVSALVRRGHRVTTVKHGHGFDLDREGTDSWKHKNVGGAASVVLAGPDGFAVIGVWGRVDGGREPPLSTLVRRHAADADIVVAEGYKASDYPCIEVFRSGVHDQSLYRTGEGGAPGRYLALLTDVRDFEAACPVLDVDDPDRFERLADLVEALPVRDGAPTLAGRHPFRSC
jgi:molybdopterin-guanine dinucleotide biosynthesis protein B